MKTYLNKLFIFLLTALLAGYLLDILISNNLSKTYSVDFAKGEYLVWNDLYNGEINSDIVIYGSSRAWVHIDPTVIEKNLNCTCYNLGIDGHNFQLQHLRHKVLLENNPKPKLIILSIDMFTLQKREDLYNKKQFLPYMLFNHDIWNYTKSYTGFYYFDYYLPLIRYSGKSAEITQGLKNLVSLEKQENCRIQGYYGMDKSWNDDFEKAKKAMNNYEVKIDTSTLVLFEEFLKECKDENLNILFVYTPEYIEGQSFIKNRDEVITLFNDISLRYNIPFLNYSTNEICYDESKFYNALHLNAQGANKFTQLLVVDIQKTFPKIIGKKQ